MPDLQVLSTLHESQTNVVLHARDAEGREIAVKIARSGQPDALRHELEISERLQDAGFRRALELTEHDGQPALHLQYVPGRPLHHLISRGPLGVAQFLEVAVPLVRSVNAMHRRDVVHRDLKPQNILHDPDSGAVHLIDFSLASLTARRLSRHAELDVVQGSLPYMSPEQTGRVNRAVDHRSDLYSLGVLFHELLTGSLPFHAKDALEWVYAHIAKAPPVPAELREELNGPLSDIILKLLSKIPEDRYQSAAGLLADLQTCAASLETTGHVTPFTLALHDRDERFRLPGRLYGREEALAELHAHLHRALAGRTACVLVAGPSGIGKTELIHELQRPAAHAGGRFVSGKFSQLHRNFPFHGIVQAVQELVRQVLGEGQASRDAWAARLRQTLQDDLGVIHQLIPEVAWITGPAAPPPELPLAEHQRRLERVFQQFVEALATPDQPLVLFVDDLQWADASTLSFLRTVAAQPPARPLLLIGAYRDRPYTTDGSTPPATNDQSAPVVRLGPLSVEDTNALLSDALQQPPHRTLGLAGHLHRRTRGNPFFVQQFLQAMYDVGALTADAQGGFVWDDDQVTSMNAAENVVELLTHGMFRLPPGTRTVLFQAACLGNTFELASLAALRGEEPHVTLGHLQPALHEGYVDAARPAYRFLHDRVLEAALHLATPEERCAVHLAAGRALRGRLSRQSPAELLFDVALHLNAAGPLLNDPAERLATATLNLQASRAARLATAYDVAVQYSTAALQFLPGDAWETQHDLAFRLHLNAAMVHFLAHDGHVAEEHLLELHARARSRTERLRVFELHIVLLNCENRFTESIDIARDALLAYGVNIGDDRLDTLMDHEVDRMRRNLARVGIDGLSSLPPMQDPEITAIYTLLLVLTMPAYFIHPKLSNCAAVMRINLLLEHGCHPSAPVSLATFARVLGYGLGDYDASLHVASVAMELAEQSGHPLILSRTALQLAPGVLHWKRPVTEALELLDRMNRLAVEIGDYQLATLAAYGSPMLAFQAGRPLPDVRRSADGYASFLRTIGSEFALAMQIMVQAIECLQGNTPGPISLSGQDFVDDPREETLGSSQQLYASVKLLLGVVFDDHTCAVNFARQSARLRDEGIGHGMYLNAEDTFLSALAMLRDTQNPSGHEAALSAGAERLRIWAEHAPQNFLHMHLLVQAELHRARGQHDAAARLYDQAANAALGGHNHKDAALACEAAARFHATHGNRVPTEAYYRAAHAAYTRWGAERKVRMLEEQQPFLRTPEGPKSGTNHGRVPGATAGNGHTASESTLDIQSFTRASLAISSEIRLDLLLQRLMTTVTQAAGATRGQLLLSTDDGWCVQAQQDAPGGAVRVLHGARPEELPLTVLEYVTVTRESVILHDAAHEGHFIRDPRVRQHQLRSVLCAPLLSKGELTGVIYLENDLTTGAFTPERALLLQVLSAQIAISIENASLYANLERKVQERTADLQRAYEDLQASEERVRHMAYHDALTGLPNRKLFTDRLTQAVVRAKRTREQFAVLFVDLDGFKGVNDTFGHEAGDALLREVAARLGSLARTSDVVARLGGDEFVLLLHDQTRPDDALAVAERALRAVRIPVVLPAGLKVTVGASIGVAVFPYDGEHAEDLLRAADSGMYAAKHAGKNAVRRLGDGAQAERASSELLN